MPTIGFVQRQIQRVEGFEIKFKDRKTLRDMHDKKKGIPSYPYQNAMRNSCTVARWKIVRFKESYSGFTVEVFQSDGSVASGKQHLGTVRDTYLE